VLVGIDGFEAVCRAAAREFATATPIGNFDITTYAIEAPPNPVLLDRSNDARLLAVGTRGAFRHGLLGSVSTAVALHAHCPLMVTP